MYANNYTVAYTLPYQQERNLLMSQNKTLLVPPFTHSSPLEMESQFPPLGICQRFFNFIFDSIVSRSLKRITLGPPKANGLVEIPITGSTGAYSDPPTIISEGGGAIMCGTQTQLQKDVPMETSSSKTNPLEGQQSKDSATGEDAGVCKVDPNMNNESAEVVPPTATDSGARGPKKVVSFRDEVEVRVMSKGKEKKTSKEKSEPDKGGKGDPPRPVKPILRVPSNINEKSDAFIRSTKEGLGRSNSSPDPRTSS